MKTLSLHLLRPRTIMMAIIAAVSLMSSAPRADAVPLPPELYAMINELEERGEARFERMRRNIQNIHGRMESQVLAAIEQGKPYSELVKIVEKASAKAHKEAGSMSRDFQKLSDKTRKRLLTLEYGRYFMDETYELDDRFDAMTAEVQDSLPDAWVEWLDGVVN